MLPRELTRRLEARAARDEAEQEAAWERALLVTNHIRGALGTDPLTLDDLRTGGEEELPTLDEWTAATAALDERRSRISEATSSAA